MTQCPSTAQVMPGGAIIRCELELDHDDPVAVIAGDTLPTLQVNYYRAVEAGETILGKLPGTPHSCTLTWANPEGVVIDPELYDPDETFDLEVDIDPAVEAYICQPCTDGVHWRCADPGVCHCVAPVDEPMPAGLCGFGGCVFLKGHELKATPDDRRPLVHSWQR